MLNKGITRDTFFIEKIFANNWLIKVKINLLQKERRFCAKIEFKKNQSYPMNLHFVADLYNRISRMITNAKIHEIKDPIGIITALYVCKIFEIL